MTKATVRSRVRLLVPAGLVVLLGFACGHAEPPGTAVGTDASTAPTTAAARPSTTMVPTTTTVGSPERVTLAFTGDLLPHTAVLAQAQAYGAPSGAAYDFRPMFDQVRSLLSRPDLGICHLEVPLSADNALIASYPSFSSPRELGSAIADAGYDGCSTASNHSLDQRPAGVVATLDVLDQSHVGHAGTARSAEEAASPVLYTTADGVVVGHVSGAYGFNGMEPDVPWRVGTLDPDALIAAGNAARAAGAELVVASLHWGVEHQHEVTPDQLALAEALTASGAFDLIVGHHAHVVQPVRVLHGVPVVFGLGNFLSNMTQPDTRDGAVVRVKATRAAGTRHWTFDITVVPTWVDPSSFTVRPVLATLAQPEGTALGGELRASWDRTIGVMTADGVARPSGQLPG